MKLKQTKNLIIKRSASFVQLQLIENQIFNTEKNSFLKLTTEAIPLLWKIANIIFWYHAFRKRILIIGPSQPVHSKKNLKTYPELVKLLKTTRHVILPANIWSNGILTNPSSTLNFINSNLEYRPIRKTLRRLTLGFDLVIIIKSHHLNKVLLECSQKEIPVILFEDALDLILKKFPTTLKLFGNLKWGNEIKYATWVLKLLFGIFKITLKSNQKYRKLHLKKKLSTF